MVAISENQVLRRYVRRHVIAELRAKLFEHKEQIGFGPIANGVVIIIEGLFYIPAALTSGLDQMFQGLLLALSIIFIFYGVWSLITPVV